MFIISTDCQIIAAGMHINLGYITVGIAGISCKMEESFKIFVTLEEKSREENWSDGIIKKERKKKTDHQKSKWKVTASMILAPG